MAKVLERNIALVKQCNRYHSSSSTSFPQRTCRHSFQPVQSRPLQQSAPSTNPDLAFVFDIDGVLVRGENALPTASEALKILRQQSIPFLLLTNGGGFHEGVRAEKLTNALGVQINEEEVIQSHTPFQDMNEYKNGTTLAVGGMHNKVRQVAERYGFENAITTSEIFMHDMSVWPFGKPLKNYHQWKARNLKTPIDPANLSKSLKIDSIFVYNDPRDWGLDLAIIIDLLLSHQGYLGTLSGKNGLAELPNNGYQQDGQPPLFFSNPDLWFASNYNLPRLGQGAFRAAIEGVWKDVTGGATLNKRVFGKPNQETYEYTEKRLGNIRKQDDSRGQSLQNVYMVGDNPESDIRGAMNFKSPTGVNWHGLLVETGIYTGGEPSVKPTTIVKDVHEAVQWGLKSSGR